LNRLAQPLAVQLQALQAHAESWAPVTQAWAGSAAGRSLMQAVDARVAAGAVVYPPQVFRALALTPLHHVKVVILGQDPYHGPGQAEGLAFSVPEGQAWPPSLRNIFKELQRDLGLALPAARTGSLLPWARQGVLLLNTTLTVEDGHAASHSKLGWQVLTSAICQALWQHDAPKVFMLWGNHAQRLASDWPANPRHRLLKSNHPSPLSALRPPLPFMGNGHFSQANRFLGQSGIAPVDWAIS
jgi:uracil-DNA glycosylase